MKATLPYALIGLGIIVMASIAWWFGFRNTTTPEPAPEVPEIELSDGLSIYTNGEQGFLLAYPEGALVTETFQSSHLPNIWRSDGQSETSGTPLLSITTYQTQSSNSYPRHFEAVLRIGMSSDPGEASACLVAQNGEQELPDRVIGGVTWKAFSFGGAAMMKYVKGVSYRTMREGNCYALETIASGSNYREDPSSTNDIADSVLDTEYAKLDTIVDTFRFAR